MGFSGVQGGLRGGIWGGSLSNAVGGRIRAIYLFWSKYVGVWEGSQGGVPGAKTHAPAEIAMFADAHDYRRSGCQKDADRHP